MLWSPKLSLSNIHVRLTAKGLLRNIHLLSGCKRNMVVFQTVDKNKPKVGSRPQQQGERGLSRPHRDVGPLGVSETRRNTEKIQHLQAQLTQSNNRFEAFTVVLQQALAQRDEAVQQSQGLSQELLELRGELVSTVNRSECLAQEKEALQGVLQQALEHVQAQHHRDLQQLEQRLRQAHEEERRASEQKSREERERSAETLQLQLEELRATLEALSLDLEQSHRDQLQSARQQHQVSLDGKETGIYLVKLYQSLKMSLQEKIRELTQENKALMEKLGEEENSRREMLQVKQQPSQKDSHTLYLEQELESLKVVLDIKNQQLHQQEKKLMEVDKLTEKGLKLEESLRKIQQENEDLKARMDRHAALSRQLSTEQALLQESLQKESKVNKRLSMENEELMWKLHNGDLSSPRKSSPNARSPSPHYNLHSPRSPSPPPHFNLQSPRSTSLFSSPPVSPR
ncbi:hypothetical protein NQD34_007735 [Periophthalmus magnuspinnatus]|nr:hypothetical protein NQD34_007735 [Periophthalmus magnuspinnatus]